MLLRSNQKLCDSYRRTVCRARRVHIVHFPLHLRTTKSILSPLTVRVRMYSNAKAEAETAIADDTMKEEEEVESFRMSPVAEKIIMLSCRWWKIVWPIFRGTAREMRNFSVTLDVIYWFIIITENEARSFLFTMSPVFLSPRRSPASCLACKFIVLLFSFFRFCLVRRTVEEGFGEFNYECRGWVDSFQCEDLLET